MKKLLFLLVLILAVSCAKDDGEQEEDQGYTSFVISGVISDIFTEAKIGYYDSAGKSVLLMELGDLIPNVDSKEFIMPEYHEVIYLFYEGYSRLERPFLPKVNKKNFFALARDERGIDASENFPH
jgi:hypothetical protein